MARFAGIPIEENKPVAPRFGGAPVNTLTQGPADLGGLINQVGMTQQQRQQSGALSESPVMKNALGDRALAGIKRTEQGKVQFLESKYGKGNVVAEGEDLFIRQNGQFYRLDEKNFTFGDIADVSGEIIAGLPATVSGFITANPGVAVAAGAAGESVRGAFSDMLPGDDGLTIGNKLARVGTMAALSGAAQVGANKLTSMVDKGLPSNILGRSIDKQMQTPVAQNNLALSQETGIPLDAAQLTESSGLEGLSGFSRMHPFSAGVVQQFDEIVAEKSVQRLTTLLDDLNSTGSTIQAGAKVASSYRSAVSEVLKKREVQAAKDFGEVRLLSEGAEVIPSNATLAEITKLVDEFDVPGGGDASATLVKRIKKIGKEISADGFTANQMQRLLHLYGKASKGTGELFKDIDKGQQRLIAGRLFRALKNDLDFAADSAEGPAAQALRVARNNYNINSAPLTDLEENVLGRIFGGRLDPAPERVVEKFATMRPSEINAAMNILDADTAQMVKREYLSVGVEKALMGRNGKFSPATFNTWFQKNSKNLQAMLTQAEFRQTRSTYQVLQKVAQRGGVDGSQTAKWLMAWDVAKNMFTINPISIASRGVQMIAPRTIAKAMTTADGRRAVLTVAAAKTPSRAVIKASALLSSLGATDAVSDQLQSQ